MGFAAREHPHQPQNDRSSEKDERSISSESQADTVSSGPLVADLAEEYTVLVGIAAQMRSGFLLFDQDEHLVYANPSAGHLLRLTDDLRSSLRLLDLHRQLVALSSDPGNVEVELARLWEHPAEERFADLALATAAIRWLRVQSFPVHEASGRLLGRGVLLDDITLERSADQARGETLAMAAHELKTPLAIIKGSATTLLSDAAHWSPATRREMLQMIDTQVDRLHEMLDTLLDVWRLDAGVQNLHLSEVHLPELVRRLVERWRKSTRHHQILCDIAGDCPPILCDPARLEQALQHLLHNAVTYSPNGGTVRVVLQKTGDELQLSISDQGKGIAAEHLDSIFDRFYRVADGPARDGGGLGLAVARATIEAHGGHIWADSPGPGAGSTFYCTLPFTPPGQQSHAAVPVLSAASPALAAPRPGQRARVALVESDPRLARYLRANLEEARYQVQVFSRGVQFLHRFDLDEPELVLLATHLPDMQGPDLLQHVREFSPVPVVMLCEDEDEDIRVHLLDLGADDLVSKPLHMKELLARLRVLQRRQHTPGEREPGEAVFTSGDLIIDYAQRQVLLQGHPVQLSRTEYKLLSVLARNAGRVLTHELLLERVWGTEYQREVDFIWVYISRLRRKIETDSRHPRYILTVPDVGYKLAKL